MDPEMMYRIGKNRHAVDLRKSELLRLARRGQDKQPNRAAGLLGNVVTFARRVGANSIEVAQTVDVPQIELGGEQA